MPCPVAILAYAYAIVPLRMPHRVIPSAVSRAFAFARSAGTSGRAPRSTVSRAWEICRGISLRSTIRQPFTSEKGLADPSRRNHHRDSSNSLKHFQRSLRISWQEGLRRPAQNDRIHAKATTDSGGFLFARGGNNGPSGPYSG